MRPGAELPFGRRFETGTFCHECDDRGLWPTIEYLGEVIASAPVSTEADVESLGWSARTVHL